MYYIPLNTTKVFILKPLAVFFNIWTQSLIDAWRINRSLLKFNMYRINFLLMLLIACIVAEYKLHNDYHISKLYVLFYRIGFDSDSFFKIFSLKIKTISIVFQMHHQYYSVFESSSTRQIHYS